MGEIVSLKLHRKQKARAEREAKAEENRLAFGRTKQEKQITEALNEKAAKDLDGHKRDE